MKQIRCAIYTRKSSDEGLEQSFNSLDAQREACAAYILSQASEGWVEIKADYDDGGLSGGTLERPALQRLLADVAARKVDIIVVYKVDRLTRSLLDFAKLVEAFDKAETSFVSVTQSFNTTTSMGRLTLNMLLSFAQFEREVTAERIRDKLAASKAKGMWMGGIPPIGYAPNGRTLLIVEEHADLVREIFRRYLATCNVRTLADQLANAGMRVPNRTLTSGQEIGGGYFQRGQLYTVLRNPIYIGRIRHRDVNYPGQHPPIIDIETWEQTQAILEANLQGTRTGGRAQSPSVLAGKIVDDQGIALVPTHTSKGKTRYRYYVSRGLLNKSASEGLRIPAREIETAVCGRIAQLLSDPIPLIDLAGLDVPAADFAHFAARARELAARLHQRERLVVLNLVREARIEPLRVVIELDGNALAANLRVSRLAGASTLIMLISRGQLKRSGHVMRLVQDSGAVQCADPNAALIRLVVQAHRLWAELRRGEIDITRLGARENIHPSYLTRIIRLAFLSPALTEAILTGQHRPNVNAETMNQPGMVDLNWKDQAARLLPTC